MFRHEFSTFMSSWNVHPALPSLWLFFQRMALCTVVLINLTKGYRVFHMARALPFHKWLLEQMDRDDEVGELSRDIQTDHRMEGMTFSEATSYFASRKPEVRLMLKIAGEEFKDYKKSVS